MFYRLVLIFFIFSKVALAQQQSPNQTTSGPVYNFQFLNYPMASNLANHTPMKTQPEEKKTDKVIENSLPFAPSEGAKNISTIIFTKS